MLTTKAKRLVAGGVVLGGLLVGLVLGATGAAAGSAVPVLSAADLHMVGITSATDVTSLPDASLPAVPVSRSQAISAALGEVGRTDTDVRVLHGSAPRFPGEPDRSVWIVMFKGGVSPFDGPPGALSGPATYSVTGVIIDDQTGEVLSGFMR